MKIMKQVILSLGFMPAASIFFKNLFKMIDNDEVMSHVYYPKHAESAPYTENNAKPGRKESYSDHLIPPSTQVLKTFARTT